MIPEAAPPTGIPAGWRLTPLKELATIVRGVSYKKGDASEVPRPNYLPILRATNIQDNGLVLNRELVYVPTKYVSAEQKLRPGDIVVATSSGSKHLVGKTAPVRTEWDGSFGAFCAVIRPASGVDVRYLAHFFESPAYKTHISSRALGVNINNLRRADLDEIVVPVAPPEQQERIVAEIEKQFSRLDEAVANLKRVKANLKRYKAAVLKAAVEGKLTSDDSGNWTHTTLGTVITKIEAGKSFKCEERQPSSADIGVVKVSAVTWGIYDEHETKTCLDWERVEPRYFIKPDDFLFSRANTIELVGACVIAHKVTRKVMLSDKILRFCLSDAVLPEWVLYWLRSDFGRKEIQRLATGNQESMRNIGQDRIRQIAFAIPPLSAQNAVVAEVERRLSLVRELESEIDTNLKRGERLRQSVLGATFSSPGLST